MGQSVSHTWRNTLTRAWLRRGPLARLLWPLSLLMTVLVRLRQGLYMSGVWRTQRLSVPVVVVGNVVAGGAGKTPTVMAVVQHLRARGLTPGVISRGHGSTQSHARAVLATSQAAEVGDEPLLIARRTGAPVWVGHQRVATAQALLQAHPEVDVLVSDDGLQHLALGRDIEVCVFDDRGVGNGWLLPAGPLREPWPRAVDLVLHTGQQPAFSGRACFHARRVLASHALQADGTRSELEQLVAKAPPGVRTPSGPCNDQPLMALAGIANPQAFFDMLQARGIQLARTLPLPDHYAFDSSVIKECEGYTVICTEKDAVKLWPLMPTAWAVPLQLDLPAEFCAAFNALLDQASPL